MDRAVTGYSRKPDPEEPWRYVCPECEHQVTRGRNMQKFQCMSCNRYWERDDLVDLKEDG